MKGFVKPGIDVRVPSKFWEVFELDSFNLDVGVTYQLPAKFLIDVIHEFKLKDSVPDVLLHNRLLPAIFTALGGKEDAKPHEVAAFTYLCWHSDNLSYRQYFESIKNSIYVATTLMFAEDTNTEVPKSYMETVKNMINDDYLFDLTIKQAPNARLVDMPMDEATVWIEDISTKVSLYIKSVDAANDAFGDLFNNSTDKEEGA